MVWQRNPGHLPPECEIWADVETDGVLARSLVGYRPVHVRLFGNEALGIAPIDTKKRGDPPWPSANGRPPTNWKISRPPHPYEIKEFELA